LEKPTINQTSLLDMSAFTQNESHFAHTVFPDPSLNTLKAPGLFSRANDHQDAHTGNYGPFKHIPL